MPSVIIENEGLIPEKFRQSFAPLINKVKGLAKVSVCKPLSGGFSDSVPLLVYADYKHTHPYQVFKIGDRSIIKDEAKNWKKFIKNGPYAHCNVIHLKEPLIPGSPHSLIVYNFAGQPGTYPITFKDLYEKNKSPENILRPLFEDILRPFSDAIRKERKHLQIQDILDTISGGIAEITNEVQKLSGNQGGRLPRIKINSTEFYNPLYFYPFNSSLEPNEIAIPIPQGIVHGDLNAMNILFYQTKAFITEDIERKPVTVEIPCIIDYAHTGEKSLYTDIAKLESVLKFQLLEVNKINPDALLQFEQENILCNLVPSDHPDIKDTDLQKLFACIQVLREIPSDIIKSDNDYTPLGYWLELYKNSLLTIKYKDLSDHQKRYAFISAALILTRYLVE